MLVGRPSFPPLACTSKLVPRCRLTIGHASAAAHAAERTPPCALRLRAERAFTAALAAPPMAEGLHGDAGRPPMTAA